MDNPYAQQRPAQSPSTVIAAVGQVLLKDHLTLVIASVVAVLAVVQLLAISHGNIQVIRALIAHADVGTLVLVAGINVVRTMFAVVLPFALALWIAELNLPRTVPVVIPIAVVAAALLLVDTGDTFNLYFIAVLLFGVATRVIRWRYPDFNLTPFFIGGLVSVIGWGLVGFAITDRPWAPAERLTDTKGGVIVGYVLGSSGDSLVILREEPREIYIRPQRDIAERTPCQFGAYESRTPLLMMLGSSTSQALSCRSTGPDTRSWPVPSPNSAPATVDP